MRWRMKEKIKKAILLGALAFAALLLAGCSSITGGASADSGGVVSIPLSELSEKAQFYTLDDRGVYINYFAVLGSGGKPRTAFDACDVCGGYKGYRQKGNDIECRNCGRVFSIDGLGTRNKGYGCWPGYLPHTVENGNILIRISDIKAGRERFA
jgi:uncharacterized membrane protein